MLNWMLLLGVRAEMSNRHYRTKLNLRSFQFDLAEMSL